MGVNQQNASYFVGKKESDLTKYFGYEGDAYDGEDGYDKILYFTNKIVTFTASKQNVTRYKTHQSQLVYRIFFAEYNDGCLYWLGGISGGGNARLHYYPNPNFNAKETNAPISKHNDNNDNAIVRNDVNKFKSEVDRLNAVSSNDQQNAFQKTNIGSWYFVYDVKNEYRSGMGYEGQPESYLWHDYRIFRMDVKADDRIETESYSVVIYNEYSDSFYDGNGTTISEERGNSICAEYEKKGFTIISSEKGISMSAYIKDGKILKVE
jgi:hypothetical protein